MKRKLSSVIAISLLLFNLVAVGCSDENVACTEPLENVSSIRTFEEAIKVAESAKSMLENNETRANNAAHVNREIDKEHSYSIRSNGTRAVGSSNEASFYVINYCDSR